MTLDFAKGVFSDLPLAYAPLELMARNADKLERYIFKNEQTWIYEWTLRSRDEFRVLHEDKIDELEQTRERCRALFFEIFEDEVNAGRLDIFELDDFEEFLATSEIIPFIHPLIETNDKVFEAFASYFLKRPSSFSVFLESLGSTLSEQRVEQFWQLFQSILESRPFEWSRALRTSLELTIQSEEETRFRGEAFFSLRAFFGFTNASMQVLKEAAFLTPLQSAKLVLSWRDGSRAHIEFKNHFNEEFPPFMLKHLNSKIIFEQVAKSGADPQVVEMLIPSWEGDLTSLIDSALTLSEEA